MARLSKFLRTVLPALLLSFPSARADPAETDLWVTVADGTPSTVTPVVTTISGTETVLDAAPSNLKETVYTRINNGDATTVTETAPIATATETDGDGAFVLCSNTDGEKAPRPFCPVAGGQALVVGGTYYIMWDPTFYSSDTTPSNSTNTTKVEITGNFVNSTTGLVSTQAFSSGERDAAWGFWAFSADSSYLDGSNNVTISLVIAAVVPGSDTPLINDGPDIVVKKPETYTPKEPTMNKRALLIGLPVSLGLVFFITCGVCWYNRKARKIGIKNIMGRGKKGYGISKSRLQRLGMKSGGRAKRDKGQDIPLMDRNGERADADAEFYGNINDPYSAYPIHPEDGPQPRSRTPGKGGRRPSDDLGSLAGGSPAGKKEQFKFNLGQGAGRNAFREELTRQNRDKLS
ncbi:hypothetical protein MKZ38_009143 [Zalerion maritima]|uniref:Uncharacterized protein n=1 Tax=Zalerion maritima TaxID=339359 RepID=A0AAD5WM69_9PEZI|nr:hypothetical protein MKZ38_009143 [Zalerion maritima]